MLRLIAIILFITFLTGCTVVKPIDRAALKLDNAKENDKIITVLAD